MNRNASSAHTAVATNPVEEFALKSYSLTSDLAQYCLPAANRDESRRLAWANSVCFLFVLIAGIGLKVPIIEIKPVTPPEVDIVPVIFTPPAEEQQVRPDTTMDEPDTTPQVFSDAPVIATVVAADPNAVAFAVPVEGPVIFAPVKLASAPPVTPPKPQSKPKVVEFRPTAADKGSFPYPTYPRQALERRLEGKCMLYVVVETSGLPSTVEVKDSSGYSIFDDCALRQVKNQWRWEPGEVRYYHVPFEFRLTK